MKEERENSSNRRVQTEHSPQKVEEFTMDNALVTLLGNKSPSEFAQDFIQKKQNSRQLQSTAKLQQSSTKQQNYHTLLSNSIQKPVHNFQKQSSSSSCGSILKQILKQGAKSMKSFVQENSVKVLSSNKSKDLNIIKESFCSKKLLKTQQSLIGIQNFQKNLIKYEKELLDKKEKLKSQSILEQKSQCTFMPRVNKNNKYQTKRIKNFYSYQMDLQKKSQEKKQQMKVQLDQQRNKATTFNPSLNEYSIELANKKKKTFQREARSSVYTRLYQIGNCKTTTHQEGKYFKFVEKNCNNNNKQPIEKPFVPTILEKSKKLSKNRKQNEVFEKLYSRSRSKTKTDNERKDTSKSKSQHLEILSANSVISFVVKFLKDFQSSLQLINPSTIHTNKLNYQQLYKLLIVMKFLSPNSEDQIVMEEAIVVRDRIKYSNFSLVDQI